jgi:ribosome-associated translation inhibitor RaiA
MLVQLNTDRHIEAYDELARQVETVVETTVGRFGDRITRVEVHLNDVNSHKGGDDKRCMLEARLAGLEPIAVSHQAATLQQAIDGAAKKLEKALDSILGRLGNKRGMPRAGETRMSGPS